MDVTPQLLREVEFREQWRGYNPDEVDDFLERLAVALEELQERLREATQKASSAEQRASEPTETEDTLRRTLVLAQRTADAALDEAREEANRLVTEARTESESLLTDAQERSERTLTEARTESERVLTEAQEAAARADEEARREAREELDRLREARDALQTDIDALSGFLEAQRARLLAVTQDQLRWLQSPGRFDLPDAPQTTDVPEPAPAPAPRREPLVAATRVEPAASEAELPADEAADDDQPPVAATGLEPADEWVGEPTGAHAVVLGDEVQDDGFAVDTPPLDDDPFMAELRRAVNDREPLGPRDGMGGDEADDVDLEGDEYDPELSPSARFRLRRRR